MKTKPKSNIVYEFSCSRDAKVSFVGMTTLHLGIRVQKHLHHKTLKSPNRDHIDWCNTCKEKNLDFHSFKEIRSCNTEYEIKIQEALLIKKHNPQLNTQVYANGMSFKCIAQPSSSDTTNKF